MPDNSARRCAPRPRAARDRTRRRSMRRVRCRGPASGSAKRCRRTACRSVFPRRGVLPDRRCGNWRNRRHRPAPCRARWSPATPDRPARGRKRMQCTKACARTCKNRPHRVISSLHRRASRSAGVIARNTGQSGSHVLSPRRVAGDITRKPRTPIPERNCVLRARGSIAEICGARAAKTNIDWF